MKKADLLIQPSGAIFDATGSYRYLLWRSWSDAPKIGFVMLNPHRADASVNDPTIRRCMGFAQAWGFGGVEVMNLFAFCAKTPQLLKQAKHPIGQDNDRYLAVLPQRVDRIVLAWGNWGALSGRDRAVRQLFSKCRNLYCLGMTQAEQPRHPLYLRSTTPLISINPNTLHF